MTQKIINKISQDLKTKYISKQAFTLVEILVALIIVSSIAGLAFPHFRVTIEKSKTGEAIQILNVILKAQKAYALENGSYTASLTDLDVEFGPISQFSTITLYAAALETDNLARVQRNTILYHLYITGEGTIQCTDTLSTWSGVCAELGY